MSENQIDVLTVVVAQ